MAGMGRRALMRWGVSSCAVMASGGILGRAWHRGAFTPGEGPAFEAWSEWERKPPQDHHALVRAAVLAASPHNTQPWKFHLEGDRIHVLADLNRSLGAMDPLQRELVIGLGCALENLCQAAPLAGCRIECLYLAQGQVQDGPRSGLRELAVLSIHNAPEPISPLARSIPRRHTNRGPYQRSKPIPGLIREDLLRIAASEDVGLILFDEGPDRRTFDALTLEATQAILEEPAMLQANVPWLRHSRSEIETNPDGVTLDNAGLDPFLLAVAKTLPPLPITKTMGYWKSATQEVALPTSPLTGFLLVKDRLSVRQSLRAGMVWQRLHLAATGFGLAMQPMNQIAEVQDWDTSIGRTNRLTGVEKLIARWAPRMELTFAFRAGYPTRQAMGSPRRPLCDVMIGDSEPR